MSVTDAELSKTYQYKTEIEHILQRPDTFIGSVGECDLQLMNVYDDAHSNIVSRNIQYVPGLYKIFDEALVNCRDHVVRMLELKKKNDKCNTVSYINVEVGTDGDICFTNDGNGIDIAMHPELNIWIPEMIFSTFRTGTNFDGDEGETGTKRTVGGKNGYGVKLISVWSLWCVVETVDSSRKLKYTQKYSNNLLTIEKPTISKVTAKESTKPYTKIHFMPDYKRFGIPRGLSTDFKDLLHKRVIDISSITGKIKMKYNGELVPINTFQSYVDLYIGKDKTAVPRIYDKTEDGRWEYIVSLSKTGVFEQVSFVNGICTSKGGKHVDYLVNQITKKVGDIIETKKKIKINKNLIKEQLSIFIRCDIENPAFDSQTKENMTTKIADFGSKCDVSTDIISKIIKWGVVNTACSLQEIKEIKNANTVSTTHRAKRLRGISKLNDANWAGTDKSNKCILILCEGDSAKTGVVSGLTDNANDYIGVYSMKGKALNVRDKSNRDIVGNTEIADIIKILGIEINKKYTLDDVKNKLRYGKIMIMCDQDLDGSHIKGLLINLFQAAWASLYEIPGFLCFMNTPILKVKKGNIEHSFYNKQEYDTWKEETADNHTWTVKYYKGLGTSTAKEFKEYFKQMRYISYERKDIHCDEAINMAFNKKCADSRKEWLLNYQKDDVLDITSGHVNYRDFIYKEMLHYSIYDCERSIPHLMDGLKTSLRKILFSAFHKNLTSEIKVAQFAGYVSEKSEYHHGEASLNKGIIGMAQNYIGSNNINLLQPIGQFGTRLTGGKDAAAERYIFTRLDPITKTMFCKADDHPDVLEYQMDEGIPIEPVCYAPIIPTLLVNGSTGIGTGYSSTIPSFNPIQLVAYLKNKLQNNNEANKNMKWIPHYNEFKGTIVPINEHYNSFIIKGNYTVLDENTVHITELPVGTWTKTMIDYYEEACIDKEDSKTKEKIPAVLKDVYHNCSEQHVNITVTFQKGKLASLNKPSAIDGEPTKLEKFLKLSTTISTSNMHVFHKNKLTKYDDISSMIDDFYEERLRMYHCRKVVMINTIKYELNRLYNKKRYIQEIVNSTIDLRNKKRDVIYEMLKTKEYDDINDDKYAYLVKMSMDSVNEENVIKLNKEHSAQQMLLTNTINTQVEQMWLTDLEYFSSAYETFCKERAEEFKANATTTNNGPAKKVVKKKVVKAVKG